MLAIFALGLLHLVQVCNGTPVIQADTTTVVPLASTTTQAQPQGTSSAGPVQTGMSPAMAAALAEMLAKDGAGKAGPSGQSASGLAGAITGLLGKSGRGGGFAGMSKSHCV
jgi:hypothetical protein